VEPGLLAASALQLVLIHRSAWKRESANFACRMPHSPARWPSYGLLETSRLLNVNHYMLHLRIKMRLVGWAATSQNTDADTGARVGRRLGGLPIIRGPAILTWM
jgi:hypothetical protein